MRLRCGRDGGAYRAVAAAGKTPGAENTIQLAHVVMQQHIRRAWRARAEHRADDAARRFRAFQRLAFEPFVEVIGRAHGEELPQCVQILLRQAAEVAPQLPELPQLAWIE